MKTRKYISLVVILFTLFSCSSFKAKKMAEDVDVILSEAPDAIEVILESFKKADIVFIGEASHQLLNHSLFLNKNLQQFYGAGVRYILVEGGDIDDGPVFSEEWLLKKAIMLLYPWEYMGAGYAGPGINDLRYEVYLLNSDKEDHDKIKFIGLESGRESFVTRTFEPVTLYNYRDEYMAKIAFDFIDNAAQGEKFLVLGGGRHGSTQVEPNAFGSSDIWKPLGVYLKEKYQDGYFSLFYITLDERIKLEEDPYQRMLASREWQNITNNPKFITPSRAAALSELFPIIYFPGFDGYIVDKNGIKGIMYSYALFDPDILIEVIEQTRQHSAAISLLANGNGFDYRDADTYYAINSLLINVYYLRLFFGDNFPYDFWNPKMPLHDALSILESNVFSEGVSPQDKMVFSSPPMEDLRDYHENMYFFKSFDEDYFWDISVHGNIKKQIDIAEPFIKKAKELFPYDLWADYWYAKMYTKDNNYKKAYEHLQIILDNPLAYSTQAYPEILEMAEQSAKMLGLHEQANEYRSQKNVLWNEYSIDVSYFYLFLKV